MAYGSLISLSAAFPVGLAPAPPEKGFHQGHHRMCHHVGQIFSHFLV